MRVFWGILLITLSWWPAHARSSLQCIELFPFKLKSPTIREQLNQVRQFEQSSLKNDPTTAITDYDLLQKVLQVYKNLQSEMRVGMKPYATSKMSFGEAYLRYVQLRKKQLTRTENKHLEFTLNSIQWRNKRKIGLTGKEDRTAAYIPEDQSIYFEMPERYQGSLIHAFMFVHEFEHGIQHIRINIDPSLRGKVIELSNRAEQERKYISELGAMTAEWIFLQGVLEEEIQAAIKQIKSAGDIDSSYKKFLTRVLTNSQLPLDQYLEKEHQAGRYSYEP